MAAKTAAELVVEITTEARDAVAGFDDVGQAARGMATDVSRAGQDAERQMRDVAGAADNLGGEAGKATGALGALSSGFELVGAEKYAGALQGAALATDFMSGAGDALNLIMESTILQNIRGKAAAVASTIATAAQTTATAAMTAAQWALNAAMSANPVALIVIAVVALVAALVLAYKKSETFRRIVDAAFRAVKGAAESAFNWVRQNWPLLLAIITGPIGLAVLAVTKNWDKISAGARDVKRAIIDRFSEARSTLTGIAGRIKDTVLAPFRAIRDMVQDILDLIGKIKIPDVKGDGLPFIPGVRTVGGSSTSTPTVGAYDLLMLQLLQQILAVLRDMYNAGRTAPTDMSAVAVLLQSLFSRYNAGFGQPVINGGVL